MKQALLAIDKAIFFGKFLKIYKRISLKKTKDKLKKNM